MTSAEHPSKEQSRDSSTSDFQHKTARNMAKTKLAEKSRECMELKTRSHNRQLDYVTLIGGELGGFRRGKHSAAMFHNSNEHVKMAVHGDDIVCLSDDDGLEHIDKRLKSQNTARDMETLGFEESDLTALGH